MAKKREQKQRRRAQKPRERVIEFPADKNARGTHIRRARIIGEPSPEAIDSLAAFLLRRMSESVPLQIDDAEEFRNTLELGLKLHARQPVELLIVDDIAEWVKKTHVENASGNPAAMAFVARPSGSWNILLRRAIDESLAAGIIGRIELGGHPGVQEKLCTPGRFAMHLVLHELAHLENEWGQQRENDCDAWAFDRMRSSGWIQTR
jgi:hypothetical protein